MDQNTWRLSVFGMLKDLLLGFVVDPRVDWGVQCEQRFRASRGVLLLCWLWGKLLAKLMFKDTSDLSRAIAVIGRVSVMWKLLHIPGW